MKTLMLVALLAAPIAQSHEGHDHDKPATLQAPKGGLLKSLEQVHVEVVAKKKDFKIYLYNPQMKPRDAKSIKITAQAELPRSKKKDEVNLVASGDHFVGSYDAKGSHRYTLWLTVTDPGAGHSDKLSFTIEK